MLERVNRGARWVKVFADFSEDFQGRINPGFTKNDAVTYPLDTLTEAIRAVHDRGARVAAHCYSRTGAEIAIEAGADSLEHGWGIDEALLDRMALRGTAWVPLVGLTPQFYEVAEQQGARETMAWIAERMEILGETLCASVERGVPVFAGTDWFPNPTVADEILELHAGGGHLRCPRVAGSSRPAGWGSRGSGAVPHGSA
jgi:imidazolonepropionase-like amidohydrolase